MFRAITKNLNNVTEIVFSHKIIHLGRLLTKTNLWNVLMCPQHYLVVTNCVWAVTSVYQGKTKIAKDILLNKDF